jgi:hypothetical protein
MMQIMNNATKREKVKCIEIKHYLGFSERAKNAGGVIFPSQLTNIYNWLGECPRVA